MSSLHGHQPSAWMLYPSDMARLSADKGTATSVLHNQPDLVPAIRSIDLPATNKVRGGLNLLNGSLYIDSGGCDAAPWRGRIYRLDVTGTSPVLRETFDVIPSISGANRG